METGLPPGTPGLDVTQTDQTMYHCSTPRRHATQKWVRRRDQAARALLGEVGLRLRPYGPDELVRLATVPSLCEYRIIVIDANRVNRVYAWDRPLWPFCTNTAITTP